MATTPFLARPFRALRPLPAHAIDVAAPPYDVLNVEEARRLAADKPHSFLRVSRAELELADGISPYDDQVYQQAAGNFARLRDNGVLVSDDAPSYYVYRIGNAHHAQTGIAFGASVAAYLDNRIRRHEHTRPAKETDRVRQIQATGAMTGLVLLAHRANAELAALSSTVTAASAPLLAATVDGWLHEIWRVDEAATLVRLDDLLNAQGSYYIADGHHRSAAAARVAEVAPANAVFPAVSFPHDGLRILPYNRVVSDLAGRETAAFVAVVGERLTLRAVDDAVMPGERGQFGMYLAGQWFELRATLPSVDALDVAVLDQAVLAPLLGIDDPRADPRIDFIGGSRGAAGVAARVDSGEMAVGFTLHSTSMQDIMAVADRAGVMPPKSTWFEPKLADGLLSLTLD